MFIVYITYIVEFYNVIAIAITVKILSTACLQYSKLRILKQKLNFFLSLNNSSKV